MDQGSACAHICASPSGFGESVTGDCSTTDSLSGFKTAFPMEVVSSGLHPAETDRTDQVQSASSSTDRAMSSECPLESTRPKQKLYPTLPVEDDPPLVLNQEQGVIIGEASSPSPFKMAVSHKSPLSSNPMSSIAEVCEGDPVDPREQLPNQVKEAGEQVPYSPDLPRVHPPTSPDKMPTPSAPPMPLPLSRPARTAGLQHDADNSPLSPMSYALNEIKSGNRDPSAIRRGLAAMASTPVANHGSESPPSSAPSGKRKRHPSPSPPPVSKDRGATSSKKVCTSMGGPQKAPSPAAAGKMNTPVIARGQSSAKKSGWLAKLFKS